MTNGSKELADCCVCGERFPWTEVDPSDVVRSHLSPEMRARHPELDGAGWVCQADQDALRAEYVRELLADERGEISEVERGVVEALRAQEVVRKEPPGDDQGTAFGLRIADRLARFGGSWTFLGIFSAVLIAWMAVNSFGWIERPFDPFPFILLNLALSCVAAMQAPVILMSQNRQSQRDRERALSDYRINLKAELEVRLISEKIDRLQMHQWQRLMEIQRIQTELIEQLARRQEPNGRVEPS